MATYKEHKLICSYDKCIFYNDYIYDCYDETNNYLFYCNKCNICICICKIKKNMKICLLCKNKLILFNHKDDIICDSCGETIDYLCYCRNCDELLCKTCTNTSDLCNKCIEL